MPSLAEVKARRPDTVEAFRRRLATGDRCVVRPETEGAIHLLSGRCRFTFYFERYPEEDDGFLLFVAPPTGPADRLHFWILRHVFGARDEGEGSLAERCANVMNSYFMDLQDGDFSRTKIYDRYERRFLDGLEKARDLAEDDPIHDKIRAFDITWVEDVERRGSLIGRLFPNGR